MATVPIYQANQVRTSRAPDSQVRVNTSLETFGGGQSAENLSRAKEGLADVLGKGANLANDIYSHEKNKADKIRIDEALNDAILKKTRYTYGSANPEDNERGFVSVKGKDAFSVPDSYSKKYKQDLSDIENSLANDAQKAMFREKANQLDLSFNEQIIKHVSVESAQYERDTIKNGVLVSRDEAVKNFGDPLIVANAIERQKSLTQDLMRSEGIPADSDIGKQMMTQVVSGTHTSIINRMIDGGEDMLAKKYFEANKSEMSGKDLGDLEKVLEESSLRGESQKLSDEIGRKYQSLGLAVDEVKKIEDPKLRDETMRRVKDEFSMKEAIQNQRTEMQFKNMLNTLEMSGGDFDKISPKYLTNLSLSERNGLRNYARSLREGVPVSTEWETYYDLKTMASSEASRDKFMTTNLLAVRSKLGDTEFKEMINLQTEMRKGGGEDKLREFQTNKQIADQTLTSIGIDTSPKPGSKQSVQVKAFNEQFGKALNEHIARTGKKPSMEEAQKIADDLAVKGVVKEGFFYDDYKRKFEVEPGEVIRVKDIGGIPYSRKVQIEKVLKKYNIPVNDKTIVDKYNEILKLESEQNGR